MNELKVLIVDESEIIQESMTALFSVFENVRIAGKAKRASDAIEVFGEVRPDVVILDIHLADRKGFEVLKAIKEGRPETTVIVFTNSTLPPYRKRSVDNGADFFLDKSAGTRDLHDVVRWLARERSRTTLGSQDLSSM